MGASVVRGLQALIDPAVEGLVRAVRAVTDLVANLFVGDAGLVGGVLALAHPLTLWAGRSLAANLVAGVAAVVLAVTPKKRT